MNVYREVGILFKTAADLDPLKKLQMEVLGLERKAFSTHQKLAALGIGAMAVIGGSMLSAVNAASDAQESMNLLTVTFEGNTNAVLRWADTTAESMKRSRYSLREMAADFGAFLKPNLKGTKADWVGMSQTLAALSVDLASFRNVSDKMAMENLRSGMSGETEAVRKYGIDISDEAMDRYNRKVLGDNRTMRAMSMQEKALIRYKMIVDQTRDAQGDAARTAGTWANQLRQMEDNFRDLKVEVGNALLPVFEGFIQTVNGGMKSFAESFKWVSEKTATFTVLGTTLKLLAVAGFGYLALQVLSTAKAVAYLAETLSFIWAAAPQLLMVAGAFLAIEDAVGFFEGKRSNIGAFFEDVLKTKEPLKAIAEIWQEMVDSVTDFLEVVEKLGGGALSLFVKGSGTLFGDGKGITADDWARVYEDAFGQAGDPKETARQRRERSRQIGEDRRRAAWEKAVATGDQAGAAASFDRRNIAPGELTARFNRERMAYLRSHPDAPVTESDAKWREGELSTDKALSARLVASRKERAREAEAQKRAEGSAYRKAHAMAVAAHLSPIHGTDTAAFQARDMKIAQTIQLSFQGANVDAKKIEEVVKKAISDANEEALAQAKRAGRAKK